MSNVIKSSILIYPDLETYASDQLSSYEHQECPGSGFQTVESSIQIEYSGVNNGIETFCKYAIFAPNARKLEVMIQEFDIQAGDYLGIFVSPQSLGHHHMTLTHQNQAPTLEKISTRYLVLNWDNLKTTNQVSKWKIVIVPTKDESNDGF